MKKSIYVLAVTLVIATLVISGTATIPIEKNTEEIDNSQNNHQTASLPRNNDNFFQRLMRLFTGEIIDIDISDNAAINPSKIDGIPAHTHWGEVWTGTGIGLEINSTGAGENDPKGIGVHGVGTGIGVFGLGKKDGSRGVVGIGEDIGVDGSGSTGVHGWGTKVGVHGESSSNIGVQGESDNGVGVNAVSKNGTALKVDGKSEFNCNATFNCNVNIMGKLIPYGGIDPPYISFSNESHESIREYAKYVEEFEVVMQFWNGDAHRMEIYVISEDAFYTFTGELIEE